MTSPFPTATKPDTEPRVEPSDDLVATQPSPGEPAAAPVRQLDAIIENLAGYAVPVLREIAARAADLAAKAGEAAGPMAHKAADKTEDIGGRLATKGREVASEMRRDATIEATPTPLNPPTTDPETQEPVATEAGLPPR